jgi:hypothetical protein
MLAKSSAADLCFVPQENVLRPAGSLTVQYQRLLRSRRFQTRTATTVLLGLLDLLGALFIGWRGSERIRFISSLSGLRF